MDAEEWKKCGEQTLQPGVLNKKTRAEEMTISQALARALAKSEVARGFFNTAVEQGYIKLKTS